jgi:ribosome recycling factor
LASGCVFYSEPPIEDHGTVVVNVKERQLIIFLSENEENLEKCINKCKMPINRKTNGNGLTVSTKSMTLEKKNHQQTWAICKMSEIIN